MAAQKSEEIAIVRLKADAQPKLKCLGGGLDDRWNNRIVHQVTNTIPGIRTAEDSGALAGSVLSGLADINPAEPIEGVIASQMIAAHEAACELYRRAWLPDVSFELRTKFLALADKASRTVAVLAEAMDRHRGRGQQTVVVKHVTVNADQAVVADKVVTGGGGGSGTDDEQPHAKAIGHASVAPMRRALQADRAAVPIAGDAERPLPDARRQIARRAEGQ